MPVQSVDAVDPARLRYPEHLPVVARRDDIAAAIRDHQVVIVAGETGSGKTTQLPKICLELGRGRRRAPDRAHPAATDRGALGRRADRRGARGRARHRDRLPGAVHRPAATATRVKVMTDGILLAELQRDRELRRYDTIIIDEAHERSLNIDFILGYLKQLLPRRPDLKVIITSATIDPERFAAALRRRRGGQGPRRRSSRCPGAPTPWRSATDRWSTRTDPRSEERDQVTGIVEAVEELWTEGPSSGEPGHPRLPLRRAGDPRRRRRADRAGPAADRGPPALRAAVGGRAAPGLRPGHAAGASCWPPTSPRRR